VEAEDMAFQVDEAVEFLDAMARVEIPNGTADTHTVVVTNLENSILVIRCTNGETKRGKVVRCYGLSPTRGTSFNATYRQAMQFVLRRYFA
jgi:hypothetical protein